MNMQTQAIKERLEHAFNQCVAREGRGHAVDALLKATGTMYWFEVAADKVEAALAALTGGVTVAHSGGKMAAKASPRDRLKLVHDALNRMAQSVYSKDRHDARS